MLTGHYDHGRRANTIRTCRRGLLTTDAGRCLVTGFPPKHKTEPSCTTKIAYVDVKILAECVEAEVEAEALEAARFGEVEAEAVKEKQWKRRQKRKL